MEIVEMNNCFWKNKRVLITGHTGFKGGWLSLWLDKLGAVVTGYALEPNTNPNLYENAEVYKNIGSTIADIRDKTKITDIVKEFRPEIVFHMAAQPLVRYSYENPVETYSTNVIGTLNLYEAARESQTVKVIVNITTDKCYENKEWIWGYRENDRLGGYDPYSNSKACVELLTSAYRDSFFKNENICVATARAGNVIGGGDWSKDRLIPDIFRSIYKNEKIKIRNPNSIRPWQFVLEPLYGYMLLAEKTYLDGQKYAEAWNFGPYESDTKNVRWIVEKIVELLGNKHKWEIEKSSDLHEAKNLMLDISKAKNVLGWQPTLKLGEALGLIIEWQESFEKNKNMRDVCYRQIEYFEKKILEKNEME